METYSSGKHIANIKSSLSAKVIQAYKASTQMLFISVVLTQRQELSNVHWMWAVRGWF